MSSGRPPFVPRNTDYVDCHICGETIGAEIVDGMDVSADDEYYPEMVPVCPDWKECSLPGSDTGTKSDDSVEEQ